MVADPRDSDVRRWKPLEAGARPTRKGPEAALVGARPGRARQARVRVGRGAFPGPAGWTAIYDCESWKIGPATGPTRQRPSGPTECCTPQVLLSELFGSRPWIWHVPPPWISRSGRFPEAGPSCRAGRGRLRLSKPPTCVVPQPEIRAHALDDSQMDRAGR